MTKESTIILVGAMLLSGTVMASENIDQKQKADLTAPVFTKAKYKYVKKPITADDGSFHGYLRMHHIFDDNGDDGTNQLSRSTGSTLGLGLGYGMEIAPGFKAGLEFYGSMDSGLTDTDVHEDNIAHGQFMNTHKLGDEMDAGYTWGAHIRYEGDNFKAQIGRSQYDSPLTNIVQITHVPNMYEYARVDTKVLGGNASLGFINKMAYGSRAQTDFGLIGEKTWTGGMILSSLTKNLAVEPPITRGDYYSIDNTLDVNGAKSDSSGIFQAGFEKKKGMWDFSVWNQYIDDVANNLYAQGSYKWPLGQGKAFKLSGHIWNQDITNSNLDVDGVGNEYGGTLLGAQALLKWGKFVGKFAYETKDDGGLLNAWGANPGYTSSIFSRNQYRSDVDAYKATFVWMPMKGLKLVASYADYGKSSMLAPGLGLPTDNATERDLVIVYKPRPDLTFKLFNANRTSEYNDVGRNRTMNHTRLIVNFAF